jgi:hypothetical protein
MRLSIKKNKNPLLYHCTSANRTIVGAKKIEFICDKIVELFFKEDTDGGMIFTYKVLGHKLAGSGLIHRWASDMEKLQDELVFKTDIPGKLISIENRDAIYAKWMNYFRYEMQEKYKTHKEGAALMIEQTTALLKDEQAFFDSFAGFNLYRIFFQGHYKEYEDSSRENYTIGGYFGEYDLPIVLNTDIDETVKESIYFQIKRKGELDKQKFNQDLFTKMIKDLTGVIDINANLNLDMEENYQFDKNNWIINAEAYLKTDAANMYALASAHSVRLIDEAEKDSLLTEFEQKETVDMF